MILLNNSFIKRTTVKRSFPILALLCLLFGCTREKDDGPSASLSVIRGDKQSGIYGELLNDTIVLQIAPVDTSGLFRIKYEAVQGNGTLEHLGNYLTGVLPAPDRQGVIKVRWRLGCNSATQKIRFSVYPAAAVNWEGEVAAGQAPLDTLVISAAGQPPVGWGRACGCEVRYPYRFKIFTHDNNRLYMVNAGLYYSGDQGINWYKVAGIPHWSDIVEAQFNSKGWLYVLTKDHGVYYSRDLASWESINNGILDYRDPTAFLVEDSTLFVSFYFDGPYKTDNNGAFWRKLLVGGNSQRFYHIRRHPNGNIYLIDDWGDLKLSENYGRTWQHIAVSYQYLPHSINDFNIHPDGTLYLGGDDATISALSPVTYTGETHRYYEWNGSSQSVSNIRFFNNDVYFLVNSTPRPGIYSRNNNWGKIDLGFPKPVWYFHIKSDGKFLLASDALYYKN